MKTLYGSHLSGGKDLRGAVETTVKLGFGTFQTFLHGPTTSKMPTGTEAHDELAAASIAERKLQLFIHGPYLMNFGSSRDDVRENSKGMLQRNLARAQRLGAQGVVVHGGSSTGASLAEGLDRLRASLLPLLEELPTDSPQVLIEPMAGQGGSLVSTLDSIPAYLEKLDYHPLLALCLDTAHLLAAGERLDSMTGGRELLAKIDELELTPLVKLFHANDSEFPRESHRDRHANLGYGHCHENLWGQLMESGVPLILETPGAHFKSDVKLLKELANERKI